MKDLPLKQIIEGAIMASEQPLSVDQLMQLFEKDSPERASVRAALKEIDEECAQRGYELRQVASGYRFQVKSDYAEWVSRLWKEKPPRYSRALLETLALVAYKQPITRGDIEEIRGVAVSTNIMRTLIERDWVRVVGHRDVPGHPALYATTRTFLDYFNLRSLDELPSLSEIRELTAGIEELEMEEELIEVRSLEIDLAEQSEVAGLDDADLDAVTVKVTNIQENIRSLFASEQEGTDFDQLKETIPSKLQEENISSESVSNAEESDDELAIDAQGTTKITSISSVRLPNDSSEN
ncbi:MAG TPA: SMC-Scp complex subunit ScpB [Gammaproteobacteria bacterium]|nr:SMC-Scp complex subunit ScpB [Gammaproteobacteria bacterium]